MTTHLRLATADDAGGILRIYAPVVRDTTTSFEIEIPTVDEMRRRVVSTLSHLPWLVAESDSRVVGYAYATRYRERAAYRWSVEVSAYIDEGSRRLGVGRALYGRLFALLTAMSFRTALAGITLPNQASVRFHESMDFAPIGVYRNVGYKHGTWCDVGWWQRDLQVYDGEPAPLRALAEIA